MMESFEWAKSYLGEVDETEFNARVERLGSVRAAVIEVLRERRAKMMGNALSVTIPGAVSVSFKDNISVLDRLIGELEKGIPGATDGKTHPITLACVANRWAR